MEKTCKNKRTSYNVSSKLIDKLIGKNDSQKIRNGLFHVKNSDDILIPLTSELFEKLFDSKEVSEIYNNLFKSAKNPVCVQLTEELHNKISLLAEKYNITESEVVRRLLVISTYTVDELVKLIKKSGEPNQNKITYKRTITLNLISVCNKTSTNICTATLNSRAKLIHILGMKNENCFQKDILPNIVKALETNGINTYIETCIGGFGLKPTLLLNNPGAITYILNDSDKDKINLYTMIAQKQTELQNACRAILSFRNNQNWNSIKNKRLNANYKKKIKTAVEQLLTQSNYDKNIISATIMMFDMFCSQRNEMPTIEKYFDKFEKHIENIKGFNELIGKCRKVYTSDSDLLSVIKKYKGKSNAVLFIDPPYYLTNGGYKENQPGHSFHLEISKLLENAKCKFVLFLRIKASRAGSKDNNNQAIDDALISFYDNHYKGKELHYIDIPVKQNGGTTIERIITNFEFNGSLPY